MPRLVRKQVYIECRQDRLLKEKSRLLGTSEAEIIREAIDRQVASVRLNVREPSAWEREKRFIAKRIGKGSMPGTRRWKREDAYDERLKRYGRQNHG